MPRRTKQALMLGCDTFIVIAAVWCAFVLHAGSLSPNSLAQWMGLFICLALVSLPLFYVFGWYNSIIRYQGARVVHSLLKGVTASSAVALGLLAFTPLWRIALPVVVVYWLLAFVGAGAVRFLARAFLHSSGGPLAKGKSVIIYGAGVSGIQTALSLLAGPEYEPVAFVDDNPSLQNTLIHGVRVYPASRLPALTQRLHADTILLAMPSVSATRRKTILSGLDPLPAQVKTLPSIAELVSGAARLDEFREVQIEDLLGRDPVAADRSLSSACVTDKVVMVTGAGGSIGSELARQLARIGPRKLVLFEMSESALYEIERDLRRLNGGVEVISILGSVTDVALLTHMMTELNVQTVYHAAAYKHVPLVEHNLLGGIRNNVIGTWRAVEAACAAEVETFVLVSTDKAVRPTNVMGASKRCAELVLQGLNQWIVQQGGSRPTVSMVRFGNVLGSSGSVVPLFREQIRDGGPVTVTHPEIIRYFMTAPEAANLVIQAGAMASGGEVFVLDMGEPVRIADLAKRMIRLAGKEIKGPENPDGDIAIQYSGLRPGEKLYEELIIGDGATGTRHRKIMQGHENCYGWEDLLPRLQQLNQACDNFDCEAAKLLLVELIDEYTPADKIYDHLWASRLERIKASLPEPAAVRSLELQ